jgi:hypothetical protein
MGFAAVLKVPFDLEGGVDYGAETGPEDGAWSD